MQICVYLLVCHSLTSEQRRNAPYVERSRRGVLANDEFEEEHGQPDKDHHHHVRNHERTCKIITEKNPVSFLEKNTEIQMSPFVVKSSMLH